MEPTATLTPPHKFQTLDGLRGVAAIVVVVFHNRVLFGWRPPHGFLAVDLFFILSGFVLSYSYQARLNGGMPAKTFLRARVIRLAPLYLLALMFGVATIFAEGASSWLRLTWKQHLVYIGLGTFLLPAHSTAQPGMPLFPYNYPSWTLFLELLMNMIHAIFLRRVRTAVLAGICLVSALLLVAIYICSRNLDAGWDWKTLFTVGISRVFFSYTCGMLLFRGWAKRGYPVRIPASFVLLLALAGLVLPTPHQAMISLVIVLVLFPIVVHAGAYSEPGGLPRRIFGTLGAASYAIYVLQSPFFSFFHWLWPGSVAHVPWSGCLIVVALVVVSVALDVFYDSPIRRALRIRS